MTFKRNICLLLAALLLVTGPLVAHAKRVVAPTILVSESFNGYATNEIPDVMSGNQASRVVWRRPGADKMLLMEGNEESFKLEYPLEPLQDNIMIEFSISVPEGASGAVKVYGDATRSFTPLNISEEGFFQTSEGKNIVLYPTGSLVDIKISLDIKQRHFSVYSGDKCVLSNWFVRSMGLTQIVKVEFEFNSPETGTSSMYLDDIMIYKGSQPVASSMLPKGNINLDEVEYVPPVPEEVGQTVFANIDFEDSRNPFGALSLVNKENICEVRYDKLRDTSYAYMKKINADDAYYDLTISGPTRYMIFQTDIRVDVSDLSLGIFILRESVNGPQYLVTSNPGGEIRTHSGRTAGTLQKGKWHNIAMAVDFKKKTFDFYMDGEKTVSRNPLLNPNMAPVELVRMTIYNGVGDTDMWLDNFWVYESQELLDINNLPKPEPRSVYPTDDEIIKAVTGFTALNTRSGNMFLKDHKALEACFTDRVDGQVFVSAEQLAQSVDVQAVKEGNGVKIGDTTITEGSVPPGADKPAYMKDGHLMVQVKPFVENVLGKRFYTDDKDLVVIGDAGFGATGSAQSISDYLMYARPSKEEMTRLVDNNNGVRPSVMITQEIVDNVKANVAKGVEIVESGVLQMQSRSDRLLDQPPQAYVIPDGYRLLEACRTVLSRMQDLCFTYLMTGDKKYADRAWVELSNAASFKDWNIYTHFLDGSEMAMAFAIGYDWLHDYWTDEQKAILRGAMMDYAIIPAYNYHYNVFVPGTRVGNNFWLTSEYNWNAVCNGGTTAAILSMIKDITDEEERDICLSVLQSATRSLEYMMPTFAPDGAWTEGAGYWGYTLSYLSRMMSTYQNFLGTDFGFMKAEGLDNTGEFIVYTEGYTGANNFHDAGMGRFDAWHLPWLASALDDPSLGVLRVDAMKLYNIGASLYDVAWYDERFETMDVELPLDAAIRNVELLSFRTSWTDASKMYLSTQGGQTNVAHHHVDGGSFVLDSMGVRWAVDLGPEDYNHPAPTEQKYRYRAESHNTILIDPGEGPGQELDAYAPVVAFETKPRGGYGILDMTDYYRTQASSVKRGFMMTDDRRTSVIRDEITLNKQSDVYWLMTTGEAIDVKEDHIILGSDNRLMRLDYLSNVDVTVEVTDAAPLPSSPNPEGQRDNSAYKRIIIKANTSGKYELTVKFTPVEEMDFCTPINNTPLGEWSIPDGQLKVGPLLESIQVDGVDLKSFIKEVSYTTVNLPADKDGLPEITATAGEGVSINITPAKDENDRTRIEVFYDDDPEAKSFYYLFYNKLKKLPPVQGMERIPIQTVTVSENTQQENPDIHAVDGDLETRWSGLGEQWIEVEFSDVQRVDAVALAFFNGVSRQAVFSLEVSLDGIHYEQVFKGTSAGGTDDYEVFDIGGKDARFVRFVGNGFADGNGWNSVTEFGALRK